MRERRVKGKAHSLSIADFRRNIRSCMELRRAASAEEALRAAADALKRHDFVASVRTYLLKNTVLTCVSDPGLANDLSILNREHPAVLALFQAHVTSSRPDGCVELSSAIGGTPGPAGVIHAVLHRGDADAQLMVRHLIEAASVRLRAPQPVCGQEVTDATPLADSLPAAREDVFATIVHEVKNALAAILAHLEALRCDRGGDPIVASRLDVLIPQVTRLAAILDGAWTFARAASESAQSASVGESLRAVVSLVSRHYRASGVELELDIPQDLPPVVGSASRLQQVWLNCFNNALAAVRAKGSAHGRIRVKARPEAELRRVSVEIADSGAGMDAKTLERLRAFALGRGEPAGTFATGIRESARILAEHGGHFDIYSQRGVGTTVRVDLACAHVQDPEPLRRDEP